ncbi:MAG: lipoyl synthase [Desulfomonilaceae bacterium]
MKQGARHLEVLDWGTLDYDKALKRQKYLVHERAKDAVPDCLALVEHPSVITIGKSGDSGDIMVSQDALRSKGIEVRHVERGGKVTFHGPGQLVAYPVIRLPDKDLRNYLNRLLKATARTLRRYGLQPEWREGSPGLWVNGKKIASVGLAIQKWVTYHGLALNVNGGMAGFQFIIPCGDSNTSVTSMKKELGIPLDLDDVKNLFVHEFVRTFAYDTSVVKRNGASRGIHPPWLIRSASSGATIEKMDALLADMNVDTVCHAAHCPNLAECFSRGAATFMILGSTCTRRCRFCAVNKGTPEPIDVEEPHRIAHVAGRLGLQHVVVTSVTRDDLPDGGAGQFRSTIEAVRSQCLNATVETLIPDFQGSVNSLQIVLQAHPDVFNHNLETVERLYPLVRPGASYRRSLSILEYAARQGLKVKSGIMLGLGESREEVVATLKYLRRIGCQMLTLGQYLRPSKSHLPVVRYLRPAEFDALGETARRIGFIGVASGPLVRSSYHAEEMLEKSNRGETL